MDNISIMAVDSALNACSVAVLSARDGQVYSATEEMQRGQAEALVPLVESIMGQAALDYTSLDLLVCTTGPGAFTGLRIGLSAARAFALTLEIPVADVTVTEVLAARYFDDHKLDKGQVLCVLLETKRDDFYVQRFDAGGQALEPPAALVGEDLFSVVDGADAVFIGDAPERFQAVCSERLHADQKSWRFVAGYAYPDPQTMIDLGKKIYTLNCGKSYRDLRPLYLRQANVSQPKEPARMLC